VKFISEVSVFVFFYATTHVSYKTRHQLLVTWCFNSHCCPVSTCLSDFLRIHTQNL